MITQKQYDDLQNEFDCSPEAQKHWDEHYCIFAIENLITLDSLKLKSMKTCIAKFTTQVNQEVDYNTATGEKCANVSLSTVYDPNPESENGKFFKATPSGNVQMNVVNLEAAEVFGQPGDEILVTFQNLSAEKRAEASNETTPGTEE